MKCSSSSYSSITTTHTSPINNHSPLLITIHLPIIILPRLISFCPVANIINTSPNTLIFLPSSIAVILFLLRLHNSIVSNSCGLPGKMAQDNIMGTSARSSSSAIHPTIVKELNTSCMLAKKGGLHKTQDTSGESRGIVPWGVTI